MIVAYGLCCFGLGVLFGAVATLTYPKGLNGR